jgi:Tfp pilus assembly protein PilN
LGRAKEINLLPEEYRTPSPKVLAQRYSPVALAFLAFLMLFGTYLRVNAECTKYRRELTLKKAQLDSLQSANVRLVRLEEIKKRLDEKRALFPKVALQEPLWGEILKEISHIIPKRAVLTGLFFETKEMAKELRLEGVTFGGDAKIVGSIVEIMEGLGKSPFFSDVWLSSTEENNEYSKSGAGFEIVCKIAS